MFSHHKDDMVDGTDCTVELFGDEDIDMESNDCPAPTSASAQNRKRVTKKTDPVPGDSQLSSSAEALEIMKNAVAELNRRDSLPYAVYLMVQECFKSIPIDRQMYVMGKIVNILSHEMTPAKDKKEDSD